MLLTAADGQDGLEWPLGEGFIVEAETFLALRGLEVISAEHCVVAGAENRPEKGNDPSRIVSVICGH